MFGLTVRQRIAAAVLLIFMAVGGMLYFVSSNKALSQEYVDDVTINQIYVDVRGAVVRPGLLCLKPGVRKFEVLKRVGGALPEADLTRINLAEFAEDGEQIYLPKKGEVIEEPKKITSRKRANKRPKITSNSPGIKKVLKTDAPFNKQKSATRSEPEWPLDINNASQTQLESVPGIGSFLAAKIIEYRNKNGNFKNYEALDDVHGIGPAKLTKLRPYLCVK